MALDPIDIIQVADACGIVEWLHPAYAKLCAREGSLTAEEGFNLGSGDMQRWLRFETRSSGKSYRKCDTIEAGPLHLRLGHEDVKRSAAARNLKLVRRTGALRANFRNSGTLHGRQDHLDSIHNL